MSKRGKNINPVPEIPMFLARYIVEPDKFRYEAGKKGKAGQCIKVYTCGSVKKHIKKMCMECEKE